MLHLTDRLLIVANAFCASRGLSQARVSTLVFGDGGRLLGIANGRDLNTRSYERAMAWFSANWPEGARWPEGVERPAQADGGPALALRQAQGEGSEGLGARSEGAREQAGVA